VYNQERKRKRELSVQ